MIDLQKISLQTQRQDAVEHLKKLKLLQSVVLCLAVCRREGSRY